MEERYLFRAKRVDNGEWVQGYYYHIWERGYILWGMTNDVPNMIEIDAQTISKCTGVRGRYSTLWEGDIVYFLGEDVDDFLSGYVAWDDDKAGFCFRYAFRDGEYEQTSLGDFEDELVVIGNIIDNPKLLEVWE